MLNHGGASALSFFQKLRSIIVSLGLMTTLCSPCFANNGSSSQQHEDALDLALKSITLSQGEGGIEVWRLKAEWANLIKQDNLILVDTPRLTYFLEDGQVMYVESDKGDVEQKKQILRFIDHVRVTLETRLLTGPLLIYDGADKSMTMPQGGEFSDTDVAGSARFLVWHINTKVIEAEGDVLFHISHAEENSDTTPAPPPPEEQPAGIQFLDESPQLPPRNPPRK